MPFHHLLSWMALALTVFALIVAAVGIIEWGFFS